jgi:F-type H+-transporting ATPase subunit epsilon
MAGEKTFAFAVLTLQQLFLQENVRFVIAPGQEGAFEILPNHAQYVFALKPGPLRIRTPGEKDEYVAVGGGFLVVQKERSTVLTRSAERPDDIDVERAQRAKQRAEERLAVRDPSIDVARAQAALLRALARLKVASYVKMERQ